MAHQIIHRAAILSGGGAVLPWDIAGMALMLHAPYEGGGEPADLTAYAQNPAITTGTAVQTATDWSGNARHPTQIFAGNRPTWNTGAQAGQPTYALDGSDEWVAGSYPFSDDMWIAGVILRGANAQTFVMAWGALGGNPSWYLQAKSSAVRATSMQDISTIAGRNALWATGTPFGRFNSTLTRTGSEHTLTVADVDITTAAGTGVLASTPVSSSLHIGAATRTAGINGQIGSLLIYHGQPSGADKAGINAWLNAEWGLP